MNKSNAKDYLPLVQALAEGRVIQFEVSDGYWLDQTEIDFRAQPNWYRIKPEPRKAWLVWLPSTPKPYAFCFEDDAQSFCDARGGHITEVTE